MMNIGKIIAALNLASSALGDTEAARLAKENENITLKKELKKVKEHLAYHEAEVKTLTEKIKSMGKKAKGAKNDKQKRKEL